VHRTALKRLRPVAMSVGGLTVDLDV